MTLALLTGATGFVGSHLLDHLLARGVRVRCTVRRTSDLRWIRGKAYEPVEGDLIRGDGLRAALDGVDTVFHVAGVIRAPSLREFRAGNWRVSKNLVEASVAAGAKRFVHVSSLAVSGPAKDGRPVREEMECAPVSLYGRTKLEGEREVWNHRGAIGVTIVRPPVVYGPRDSGLYDMYKVLSRGLRPEIGGPKYASIIHVEDLVRGIADAAAHERGSGQIFYLSNERYHAYSELMGLILQALERKRAVRFPLPDRVLRFMGHVADRVRPLLGQQALFSYDKALEMTQPYWICSPARAKEVLGWEARVGIERGLRETLVWYREQGWL